MIKFLLMKFSGTEKKRSNMVSRDKNNQTVQSHVSKQNHTYVRLVKHRLYTQFYITRIISIVHNMIRSHLSVLIYTLYDIVPDEVIFTTVPGYHFPHLFDEFAVG